MKEKIKHTGNVLRQRWLAKMPKFFKRLSIICTCIVGTAIGVNTMLGVAGATPHEWWTNVYPLLIGVPTGMAIVCKLTVAGGYQSVDPDKLIEGNPIISSEDTKDDEDEEDKKSNICH